MRGARTLALVCAIVGSARFANAGDLRGVSFGTGGIRIGEDVVFGEAVNSAALDPEMDLLWFRTGGTLQVIDLRDKKLVAVPIVENLPEEGAFAVEGMSNARYQTEGDPFGVSYPALQLGKTAVVVIESPGNVGFRSKDEERRSQIEKAKVIGAKWLKRLKKRKARERLLQSANQPAPAVTLPEAFDCLGDDCGTATTLGDTRYRLVVIDTSFVDRRCVLYDPDFEEFSSWFDDHWGDGNPQAGSCDAVVTRSGDTFVVDGSICKLGKTLDCDEGDDEGDWAYVGWSDVAGKVSGRVAAKVAKQPRKRPPPKKAAGLLPLAYGDAGIQLGYNVIFAEKVTGAAYDDALEIVWFRTGTTLQAIDLRDKAYAAIPIAKNVPLEGDFEIEGVSRAVLDDSTDPATLVLKTGKTTKITGGKAKLVGAKWLKKLAKRTAGATSQATPNAAAAAVAIPHPDLCTPRDRCGSATSLGATAYDLVVVSTPEDDLEQCLLYDTTRALFASPQGKPPAWTADVSTEGTWYCNAVADPSGTRYFADSLLCDLDDDAVVCTYSNDWTYVGWAQGNEAATDGGQALEALRDLVGSICGCADLPPNSIYSSPANCRDSVGMQIDSWAFSNQVTDFTDPERHAVVELAEAIDRCVR